MCIVQLSFFALNTISNGIFLFVQQRIFIIPCDYYVNNIYFVFSSYVLLRIHPFLLSSYLSCQHLWTSINVSTFPSLYIVSLAVTTFSHRQAILFKFWLVYLLSLRPRLQLLTNTVTYLQLCDVISKWEQTMRQNQGRLDTSRIIKLSYKNR